MRWLFLISIFIYVKGAILHFNLYKKEGDKRGNRLLVIGGIHGNEPGGYYSASFLVKYYKIKKGSLWVVPNLNFDSLIKFKRGIYGDMNRKFSHISKMDKDYLIIKDIKKIILHPDVDLILNLHDGHGFYRQSWENSIFNPSAWGQTCIIDQERIDIKKFGNLNEIAKRVAKNLNSDLKANHHCFNIKNTKTKFKDEQMRLSLTYFAITNSKPAFAIETSKNIKDLATKIFYQLRAIEEFMKILGIEYKREFLLTIKNIQNLLKKREFVIINKNEILPLQDLKPNIYYFPFIKNRLEYNSTNPLVALIKEGSSYALYRGDKKVTLLHPQYFEGNCKLDGIKIEIDSKIKEVKIPSIIKVKDYFKVLTNKRVNVIGFDKKANEANIKIYKNRLLKRYAIDKKERIYRVEIYQNRSFCGNVLVEFD